MRRCPKTVILILPQKEKDLRRVAYLGETLRQAQGDTLGLTFEVKLGFETEEAGIGYVQDSDGRH